MITPEEMAKRAQHWQQVFDRALKRHEQYHHPAFARRVVVRLGAEDLAQLIEVLEYVVQKTGAEAC